MPIDIRLVREQTDQVRESQRRRFRDEGLVDKVLEADRLWRQEESRLNGLRHDIGCIQKEISAKKKRPKGRMDARKSWRVREILKVVLKKQFRGRQKQQQAAQPSFVL
eukprot:gnl/MRDRNA2_/MRDRNA2_26330_c0_seq1.p1 gnl/MRDRNA2_/MRDRNA2_26330_c0~~gnl/MRDRNA2_/MRDRNA2_26330_c0_seq1.p1  ORF type:complete len:108 (+),score=22.01 gnl/MRDRNA2_/MRDRNA2_26330_c0_seq1:49-372(+)